MKNFSTLLLALLSVLWSISALAIYDEGYFENQQALETRGEGMLQAAYMGYRSRMWRLMNDGVSFNFPGRNGGTALMVAVIRRHGEIVGDLLGDPTVDVTLANLRGNTALHVLMLQDDNFAAVRNMASYFAERASRPYNGLNALNNEGLTPLSTGMSRGHLTSVRTLASVYGILEAQNANGLNQISYALSINNPALTRIIIEAATNLHLLNADGTSVLTWAIQSDVDIEVISQILQVQGADEPVRLENMQDANGDTPLHMAVAEGRNATVELLLARGVDLNIGNAAGQTPYELAVALGEDDIALLLAPEPIVEMGAAMPMRDMPQVPAAAARLETGRRVSVF